MEQLLTIDTSRIWVTASGQGLPCILCNGGPGCDDYLQPVSALNDIDVIYHDATESNPDANLRWESILEEILPGHCWQVRNQALMHMRNGHQPYQSSAQAMRHWPEIETAVGVRIDTDARLAINAPFGTSSLEKGFLTANPNAPFELFRQRVQKKHWLERWPKLKIRDASSMAGPSSSTEA